MNLITRKPRLPRENLKIWLRAGILLIALFGAIYTIFHFRTRGLNPVTKEALGLKPDRKATPQFLKKPQKLKEDTIQ